MVPARGHGDMGTAARYGRKKRQDTAEGRGYQCKQEIFLALPSPLILCVRKNCAWRDIGLKARKKFHVAKETGRLA